MLQRRLLLLLLRMLLLLLVRVSGKGVEERRSGEWRVGARWRVGSGAEMERREED